jgi:hypothetical protein
MTPTPHSKTHVVNRRSRAARRREIATSLKDAAQTCVRAGNLAFDQNELGLADDLTDIAQMLLAESWRFLDDQAGRLKTRPYSAYPSPTLFSQHAESPHSPGSPRQA